MKVGIVSREKEGPVGKAVELVAKTLTKYQFERFSQTEFQPKYIPEKSLDAVIFEGSSAQDEGFATAIKRHVSVPVFYLAYGKVQTQLDGIEIYHVVEQGQEKNFIQLIARLTEVLK